MKKTLLSISLLSISMGAIAQIPLDYYAKLDGKTGRELKQAIHELVNDDVKMLSYGSGTNKTWWGFYVTDHTPDNKIRDRYSDGVFEFGDRGASNSSMNIEHSFPKSWWGGTENNAYKDLLNLMPCESTINNWKSNYPMGPVDEVWRTNDVTKVGAKNGDPAGTTYRYWEPADKWKGDFARGYMYMATAYQDFTWSGDQSPRILNTEAYPTLQPWAYELYLQWAKQDPVDEIETARNVEVMALQGNRNPYVDFPNLAEYVWGDSVGTPFHPLTAVKSAPAVGLELLYSSTPTVVYSNSFLGNSEGCKIVHNSGTVSAWTNTEAYGWKASGSRGSSDNLTCYDVDEVLLTPYFSFSGFNYYTITFDHAVNFLDMPREDLTVELYIDYDRAFDAPRQAPDGESAEAYSNDLVNIDGHNYIVLPLYTPRWPLGTSWTFFNSKEVSLGKGNWCDSRIGFHYKSSTARAATWEIKNFEIKEYNLTSGIDDIRPDFEEQDMIDAEDLLPVEYFTIDGRRLPSIDDAQGCTIVVCRRGSHVWKLRR